MSSIAAFALVVALVLQGTSSSAPRTLEEGTSSVSGRVIDGVTKAPIQGARIRLLVGSPIKTVEAITDADGRYELPNVPSGKYLIRVERAGYYLLHPSGTPSGSVDPPSVEVVGNEKIAELNFFMNPGATIQGVVNDEAGRPLSKASVVAMAIDQGRVFMSSVLTNARGEYDLAGLPNGVYAIAAIVSLQGDGGVAFTRPEYPRTYYPGVTNLREASAISVSTGDVVRDVNIVVRMMTPIGVSGRIVTPTGDIPDAMAVVLESSPAGSRRSLSSTQLGNEGRFAFPGVKTGRYILWARGAIGDELYAASFLVGIGDGTITEIDLVLAPTAAVEGRVVTESGEPLPIDGLRVVAQLSDGPTPVQFASPDQADVLDDGTFVIQGLFGERIFRLNGLPPEWSIKKVLNDRREVGLPHVTMMPGTTIRNIQIVIGVQ